MSSSIESLPSYLPIIHRNGSSAESLSEDYLKAKRALRTFREAFANIEFNARDYYVHEGLWQQALKKRVEMFSHIEALSEYINEHQIYISEWE